MRLNNKALAVTLIAVAVAVGPIAPAAADSVDGTILVGGIYKDETQGDLSAVPETFNIYDGFSISRIDLRAKVGSRNFFHLDLHEINMKSSKGAFTYRVPDLGSLTVRHDQHRQLLDATGGTFSMRRDWHTGLRLTPGRNLRLLADYGWQSRRGFRIGYPAGTNSFLDNTYDYDLETGRFEAEVMHRGYSLAVSYEMSRFEDDPMSEAERKGQVYSARLRGPCLLLPDRLTHLLTFSYGLQRLEASGLEDKLSNVQYVGILRLPHDLQLQYRFYAGTTESAASGQKTDNVRNDVDLTWYNRLGSLFAGYGYVTNDDYEALTRYDVWRVGGNATLAGKTKVKVSYATSAKKDENERTLLRDIDVSRLHASVRSQITPELTLGASFVDRSREYPALDVQVDGRRWGLFGRLARTGLGAVQVDYTYSDDDYQDHTAGFRADNHAISARVDYEKLADLRLSAGVTWLDVGKDLDIEKSILSFSGQYDFLDDWFVEAKYNVYNHDDFILVDRYYTANVVWLNLGYRLSVN